MAKKSISSSFLGPAILALMSLPRIGMAFAPGAPPVAEPISVFVIIDRIFLLFVWPVVVFLVIMMLIIAGFKFLTAQGEGSRINEARQALLWAIVGVAAILLSFSIIFTVRVALNV